MTSADRSVTAEKRLWNRLSGGEGHAQLAASQRPRASFSSVQAAELNLRLCKVNVRAERRSETINSDVICVLTCKKRLFEQNPRFSAEMKCTVISGREADLGTAGVELQLEEPPPTTKRFRHSPGKSARLAQALTSVPQATICPVGLQGVCVCKRACTCDCSGIQSCGAPPRGLHICTDHHFGPLSKTFRACFHGLTSPVVGLVLVFMAPKGYEPLPFWSLLHWGSK